jgi:large subunit ribosomal protein L6
VLLSSAGTDGTANSVARVTVHDASIKEQRACWGLSRALLANAVAGVSTSFSLTVRLVGIGYRATLESTTSPTTGQTVQRMNLKLGFGHPVLMPVPADIGVEIPSPTTILLTGIDRQRLGEFAARIRSWRVPEPYKVSTDLCFRQAKSHISADNMQLQGKGIFVGEETVRRKEVRSK